jgi:hypothetical protein
MYVLRNPTANNLIPMTCTFETRPSCQASMLNAHIRRINNLPQSDQGLSLELVMPSYSCGVDVAVALSIRCLLESEASVRVSHNTKNRHRAILLGPYGPSCFCRGPLASVFGGGDGGGSTAAQVIIRQHRLLASAAFRLASIC